MELFRPSPKSTLSPRGRAPIRRIGRIERGIGLKPSIHPLLCFLPRGRKGFESLFGVALFNTVVSETIPHREKSDGPGHKRTRFLMHTVLTVILYQQLIKTSSSFTVQVILSVEFHDLYDNFKTIIPDSNTYRRSRDFFRDKRMRRSSRSTGLPNARQ